MQLSISNIGWAAENDRQVYGLMKKYGFQGLEIAPTRIFPETPYARNAEAEEWSKRLRDIRASVSRQCSQSGMAGRRKSLAPMKNGRHYWIIQGRRLILLRQSGAGILFLGVRETEICQKALTRA